MSPSKRNNEKDDAAQSTELASSHGTQSRSMTPKDVAPEDAAHRDVTERKLDSHDMEEKAQALLDEAVEQTFPASDPIAVPTFEEALEIVKGREAKEDAARRAQARR